MRISGSGWELFVRRLGLHRLGEQTRTYGAYQVYLDGAPVARLAGFVCECIGPGDNSVPGNAQRIRQGRYPLSTQFGENYRTIGYSEDMTTPATRRMPGLLLRETHRRTAILIHPGHPPNLFLSSVGCLNLTRALAPNEDMDFWESRARVIALIDNLREFAPTAFVDERITPIPNARVVIEGEPMHVLDPVDALVASREPPDLQGSAST